MTRELIPLDNLDLSPAFAARDHIDPDHVSDMVDSPETLPEIPVHRGPTVLLASDGAHRSVAFERLGMPRVPCKVTVYATDTEATYAAWAEALSNRPNKLHGLKPDKKLDPRARVRAFFKSPIYPTKEKWGRNEIKTLCGVSGVVVTAVARDFGITFDKSTSRKKSDEQYPPRFQASWRFEVVGNRIKVTRPLSRGWDKCAIWVEKGRGWYGQIGPTITHADTCSISDLANDVLLEIEKRMWHMPSGDALDAVVPCDSLEFDEAAAAV